MFRENGRNKEELRDVSIEVNVLEHAEGSCMISYGKTKILCTATIENSVPKFMKNKGIGWISAEYSMLPRSTHNRIKRDITLGKQNSRSVEIQRLISRSLRAALDLKILGERQIIIDCDVIQADGGTRTASITGGYVALFLAINRLMNQGILDKSPIIRYVAAVSCGIIGGDIFVDLNYEEDSTASVDANFVMSGEGYIIETQGCAERDIFTIDQFNQMLNFSKKAIINLIDMQKKALKIL